MLRLFLILFIFTFPLAAQAQSANFNLIYPQTLRVPKEAFEQFDRKLFSQCATGNCNEGNGVWVEVIAEGYSLTAHNPDEARKANLMIRITRGTFEEGGKICRGEQTFKYVPMQRTSQDDQYLPLKTCQRLCTSTADLTKGLFTRSYHGYYTDDEVILTGMARRFGYKNVQVVTRSAAINFAKVEYSDTGVIRSFSGIVDENLRPVYGVGYLRNGTVFNGFFFNNQPGPGYLFKNATATTGEPRSGAELLVFLPGQKLLRTLFTQKAARRHFELKIGWGSGEQEREAGMPGNTFFTNSPVKETGL